MEQNEKIFFVGKQSATVDKHDKIGKQLIEIDYQHLCIGHKNALYSF
jgi:hypothetical protein